MTALAWIGAAAVVLAVLVWMAGAVILTLIAADFSLFNADAPFFERAQVTASVVAWPVIVLWWVVATGLALIRRRLWRWI